MNVVSFLKCWECWLNAGNFQVFHNKWSSCCWASETVISNKNLKIRSMSYCLDTCRVFMSLSRSTGLKTSWPKAKKSFSCTSWMSVCSIPKILLSESSSLNNWENLDSSSLRCWSSKPKKITPLISSSSPWWPKVHGENSLIGPSNPLSL